ncbi:ralBP1-associated Eps domain-containing protein 1 isoform X2 [Hydra vulgaris]|uniref:RalBP1-associated Eps domain-containing protein 1 isoform X2 n=1 Tax=Hydra vulgaris TaxID=6087 RepID=A0ABM4BJ53_HYDVU
MEFDQSDNDEEDFASFISEKKKKESLERKKKSKGGPIFRSDKKGDTHTPIGLKQKHVHGVVGPADYMFDQTSPNSEVSTPNSISSPSLTSTQLQNTPLSTATSIQQRSSLWNTPQHNQFTSTTNYQQVYSPTVTNSLSQQPTISFSSNFLAQQVLPNRIDRPHSATAVLTTNDNALPSSPIPFKQSFKSSNCNDVSPQKVTLLSQAISSNVQLPATPTLVFQRNQSYSNAISAQGAKTQLDNESNGFNANFEIVQELSTEDLHKSPENTSSLKSVGLSSELWNSSSVQNDSSVEAEWANFPGPASSQNELDDNESNSSASRMNEDAESITGSESSLDSEVDAWQINDEQREYYTNQFINLNPENGFVKGPLAREFFLKSNLPTETLSKIWNLSDLDKDYALNLEEFCIAMHLVVAVRHGMELPSFLPITLLPKIVDEAKPFEADLGSPDDESFEENEYATKQKWGDEKFNCLNESLENSEVLLTHVQPLHTLSDVNTEMTSAPSLENIDSVEAAYSPNVRKGSTPFFKDSQAAIARPRASGNKNVNLMDASPWQLLPPPSSKISLKKSLNLDSNDDLSNFEENASLVSIDRSGDALNKIEMSDCALDGISPVSDFDSNNDQLKLTTKHSTSLLKEKSRSIDSLRSDISESNENQYKKPVVRMEKRRSLTFDKVSCSSETSLHEKMKDFELPPVPPPRNRGHVRASSLDINHLLNSKTISVPDMLKELSEEDNSNARIKPAKPPRISKPLNANTEQGFLTSPTHLKHQSKLNQRTLSVDSEFTLHPKSIMSEEILKQEVVEKQVSFKEEKVNKPKPKVQFADNVLDDPSHSTIEVQMRRNELQARLLLLQSKNSTLLSLNKELNMEWKELCEKRITYESQLQKMLQKTHKT